MYGVPHIATGDMLREMRELDTPVARELRAALDRGDLVNDELMIDLIRERLSQGDTVVGFVLDGFPRTLAQAEALHELLRELGRDLDIVFDLQVPKREMLLERLLRRAADEGRSDDTPEVIERRLELYESETAPLVDYYRTHQANVVGIHADRSVDEVFHEVEQSLESVEARA
jgi:adenylate kinase